MVQWPGLYTEKVEKLNIKKKCSIVDVSYIDVYNISLITRRMLTWL